MFSQICYLLQVGEDVILYAMLRSDPVAKGTITSTNPNTVLGGENLGTQFCEVVVNVVLKRDADLPRPYDHMETMGDAQAEIDQLLAERHRIQPGQPRDYIVQSTTEIANIIGIM